MIIQKYIDLYLHKITIQNAISIAIQIANCVLEGTKIIAVQVYTNYACTCYNTRMSSWCK